MRDTPRGILIGIVGTLALVGAGVLLWWVGATRGLVLTDGARIRVPAADATARVVLWEPADLLPAWINQGDETYEPHLSSDGNTLLMVRGRAGGTADMYAAQRTPHGWSEPFPLTDINSTLADELGPRLTSDGATLYFYSDRAGGHGGYDLWRARRTDDPATPIQNASWSPPENLGPLVNSPFNDYGPAPTPDGTALYFASNRPPDAAQTQESSGAWPATVREDRERRDYDLYAAPLTERGPGAAARVEPLCTAFNEATPALSPGGDFIYFASDRPGGAGGLDLYRARLRDGRVMPPEELGWPVNTASNELDPALSMHGFALHFSSNRAMPKIDDDSTESDDGVSETESSPTYAIYSTVSREVFEERAPLLAGFDWNAAWGAVWPWLLLLALMGLLLLLLRRLLRDEQMKRRWRTLSLLAKCLILSLMLHSLLAALFTVWYVAGSVGDMIRRSGGTRVALVSRAVGGDLASQIRGGLTDLSIRAQPVEEPRASPTLDSGVRMLDARFDAATVATPDQPLPPLAANVSDAAPIAPHPPQPEVHLASYESSPSLSTPTSNAARPVIEVDFEATALPAELNATEAALPLSAATSVSIVPVENLLTAEATLTGARPDGATPGPTPPAPGVSDAQIPAPSRPMVVTPAPALGRVNEEASLSPALAVDSAPARAQPHLTPSSAAAAMAPLAPASVPAGADATLDLATLPPASSDSVRTPSVPTQTSTSLAIQPVSTEVTTALPTARAGSADREPSLAVTPDHPTPTRHAESPVTLPESRSPVAVAITPSAASGQQESSLPVAGPASGSSTPSPAPLPPASAQVNTPAPHAPESLATPTAAPVPMADSEPTTARSALAQTSVDPSAARSTMSLDSTGSTPAALKLNEVGVAIDEPSLTTNDDQDASIARHIGTPAPSSAAEVLIDTTTRPLRLSLPTPSAVSRSDTDAPTPILSPTDHLIPTRTTPDDSAILVASAPSLLMVDGAGVVPTDHSLASPTESRVERTALPQLMPPAPVVPIDLSSLPVPSLALPEATPEPPASTRVEPIGTLAGVVRDADTGSPIAGARVRLDLTDAPPIVARTNTRGQYRLRVPAGIPENVAISGVAPGYTPSSINVGLDDIERAERRGEPLARDFDLAPLAWDVVPIEQDPEVHHLGNDEFEGAINSQFQRQSEGLTFLAEFALGPDQVYPDIRAAELLILAKGAQADNPIRINGRELDAFIVRTPADGSFGELIFRVPPRWLREGTNTVEIFSVRGSNDLDDFEFVNPRLRLRPSELRDK